MEVPPQTALVLAAQAGDQAAFETLVNAYRRELLVHCYRMLGSFSDAEDLVQETLLRAWEKRATLTSPEAYRAWLYRIATNLCMDQLRRRSRVRRIFGIAVNIDPTDQENDEPGQHEIAHPTSTAGIDGVGERDHIARALRKMPPKYATCLVLHSAQGLSYREIAEILNITTGAAAVRLARARDMFARCYDELKEEGTR